MVPAALILALLPVASTQPRSQSGARTPEPPEVLYGDLFVAVQEAQLLPDNKAFADAVPKSSPAAIVADFHRQRPTTPSALRAFVEAHFTLPADATAPASVAQQVSISGHIDALWDPLTRGTPTAPPGSSALPLPAPYVVPGGRFRELYYWDSYFTMLGLAESGRRDLLENMVRDFAYLIDTYGHVPNGTRTYYLSRSQPPFFYEMVGLLSPSDPSEAYARYLPQLQREYGFWMQGATSLHPGAAHRRVVAMADGSILNRYWDDRDSPRDESYWQDTELARGSGREAREVYRDLRAAAESGWDFGSRWLADGRSLATIETTQIVPIDLNSLLYGLEDAIRAGCEHRGEHSCAADFARRAAARRAAVDRYLWDAADGIYVDYHWPQRRAGTQLTAATLYPLFVGLASMSQAAAVGKSIAHTLLEPGGLGTSMLTTGQQWDLPNGWAPLQWIAVAGLRATGQASLAEAIACRFMANVNGVYQQSGKLVEKYDVVSSGGGGGGGGEYPLQDGFGWTNGVVRKLMALYPTDAGFSTAAQCPQP